MCAYNSITHQPMSTCETLALSMQHLYDFVNKKEIEEKRCPTIVNLLIKFVELKVGPTFNPNVLL